MSMGAKRYPRKKKIGHNAWANYDSSGKQTSTTHKIQNVTTTIAAGKTRKQTTNLGGGLYQVIGGKSTLGKKPKPSKVRTSKSLHTTFPTTPAVTVKPNRLKPIPIGRPGRGGALIWSWILMPLFRWLFASGIRLLFSSDRRARKIDDDQQKNDDYEQGEPIEDYDQDELIDEYDEDELVEDRSGGPLGLGSPRQLRWDSPARMDFSKITDDDLDQTAQWDDADDALWGIQLTLDPDNMNGTKAWGARLNQDGWSSKTVEERRAYLIDFLKAKADARKELLAQSSKAPYLEELARALRD